MELASGFIHLIINKQLTVYGSDLSIGAMATITSICLMFLMPVYGLSQAMQIIVAYNYGSKSHNRARQAFIQANVIAIVMLTIGFILIRVYPIEFISIFTNDKNLINIALEGLKIYSMSLPIVGISILSTVYFQSINKTKLSIVMGLLRQVIFLIPIIILIPRMYNLDGIWMSQPLADIFSMITIIVIVIKSSKLRENKQ